MKKITLFVAIVTVAFFLGSYALAAEDFQGWDTYVYAGIGEFTPDGTSMDIHVSGEGINEYAWAQASKAFPDAYGMTATFKVNNFSGYDVAVGLKRFVGATPDGNLLYAQVWIGAWQGRTQIGYRVREWTHNDELVRELANGVLGAHSGMWDNGQEITIGLARIGNDIYFYTPEVRAFATVHPLFSMSDSDWKSIGIFGWANAGENISAKVSNLKVAYSRAEVEALFGNNSTGGGCVNVGNDLTLTVPCAEYNGLQLGFTLNPYANPNNPFGYYWELDLDSIIVK